MKKLRLVTSLALFAATITSATAQCDFLPNSTITDSGDEAMLLIWLDAAYHFEPTLLYRASENGSTSADFHNHADGVANTVTIIKTTDGFVFGGFNETPWEGPSSGYYADSPTGANFLFEMNTYVKWPIRPDRLDYGTYNRDTYGPTFGGGHDIYLQSDMTGGYCYAWAYEPESGPMEGTNTTFGGSYNTWTVADVEVWQMNTSGTSVVCDSDGDGLSDADEILIHGTDNNNADTDSDGLNDYDEIIVHLSDALDPDSDDDGLTDGAEINTTSTNPMMADSDDDGCDDLTQSTFNCPGQGLPGCPTDITGNGYTDTADMLIFLQHIGSFCD